MVYLSILIVLVIGVPKTCEGSGDFCSVAFPALDCIVSMMYISRRN